MNLWLRPSKCECDGCARRTETRWKRKCIVASWCRFCDVTVLTASRQKKCWRHHCVVWWKWPRWTGNISSWEILGLCSVSLLHSYPVLRASDSCRALWLSCGALCAWCVESCVYMRLWRRDTPTAIWAARNDKRAKLDMLGIRAWCATAFSLNCLLFIFYCFYVAITLLLWSGQL